MAYILKGTESFDAAHYLIGHSGKCANLHGHRWKVDYSIKSDELIQEGTSRGMVIDFGDIKKLAKEYFDKFDHKLLVERTDDEGDMNFLATCVAMGFDVAVFPMRTTAENLAKFFRESLEAYINSNTAWYDFLEVSEITVWETPNNSATYTEDI